LDGTGEILLESADRAAGYFTTHTDTPASVSARTAGVYWRADPGDMNILDGSDNRQRAELIAERLRAWKSITSA
jgi:hypothetical protein